MGMSKWELLQELEIPLAIPVIIAGLRTAAVMNIGVAAIATYIGAGGLGVYIQQGIARVYPEMILSGAILVSLLAIIVTVGWPCWKGLRRLKASGYKGSFRDEKTTIKIIQDCRCGYHIDCGT
ncbi:hypothetical protein THIOSC15_2510002 [uncultured Thiomicrorhabdus sp.]